MTYKVRYQYFIFAGHSPFLHIEYYLINVYKHLIETYSDLPVS